MSLLRMMMRVKNDQSLQHAVKKQRAVFCFTAKTPGASPWTAAPTHRGTCNTYNSPCPPRRGGGKLRRNFSVAHCVNLGKKLKCPFTQQSYNNPPEDQKFGSSLFKGSQGSKGRRPWSQPAGCETPFIRRRSKGVNSKTVRWTVFEEGKPCKRGFPFEKPGLSFLKPLAA